VRLGSGQFKRGVRDDLLVASQTPRRNRRWRAWGDGGNTTARAAAAAFLFHSNRYFHLQDVDVFKWPPTCCTIPG